LECERFSLIKEFPVQFIRDPEELKNAIQFGKEFAKKLEVTKVTSELK
jgi:hypothetical protein